PAESISSLKRLVDLWKSATFSRIPHSLAGKVQFLINNHGNCLLRYHIFTDTVLVKDSTDIANHAETHRLFTSNQSEMTCKSLSHANSCFSHFLLVRFGCKIFLNEL